MKNEEVFAVMQKDSNFNFVAITVTPWQSNGIDAYIMRAKEHGKDINGYILLYAHAVTGAAVFPKNFITEDSRIKFLSINPLEQENDTAIKPSLKKRIKATLKSVLGEKILESLILQPYRFVKDIRLLRYARANLDSGREIIVMCPGLVLYGWMHTIAKIDSNAVVKFVLLDDGSGTFIGYGQKATLSDKILIPLVKRSMEKRGRIEEFTLLRRNAEGVIDINRETAKYYSRVFQLKGSREEFKPVITPYEGRAVMSTQCLQSNGFISGDEDLSICFDGMFRILQKYDVKPVIKPHPREKEYYVSRYRKYDAYIDLLSTNKITLETIIANLKHKPPFVFGIFSSSLVNAKIFFDIPAISLAKFFLNDATLSEQDKKRIKDYISIYGGIIDMPETWDEVEELVKKYTH